MRATGTLRQTLVLIIAALPAAACSDEDPTAANAPLSAESAALLAAQVDRTAMDATEATLVQAEVSGESTYTFQADRPCPQGGTLRVAGTIRRSEGTLLFEGTHTLLGCSYMSPDAGIVTLEGALTTSGDASFGSAGGNVASFVTSGAFEYTGNGVAGSCDVNLTTGLDFAAANRTVSGTFCGMSIDRSAPFEG